MDDLRRDTLSTCDIEMDKSMYWVPALMYEGTPAGHPRIYLAHDTKKARTLSDRPRRAIHDPDT
jgi:hypothetical protein